MYYLCSLVKQHIICSRNILKTLPESQWGEEEKKEAISAITSAADAADAAAITYLNHVTSTRANHWSAASQVSVEQKWLNVWVFFFFFAFMEMDWKGLNNFSCEVCRSLAIPLFCHCQFVFLFDMHVICIMHICRPALTHSLTHSLSLSLSLSLGRSFLSEVYLCDMNLFKPAVCRLSGMFLSNRNNIDSRFLRSCRGLKSNRTDINERVCSRRTYTSLNDHQQLLNQTFFFFFFSIKRMLNLHYHFEC